MSTSLILQLLVAGALAFGILWLYCTQGLSEIFIAVSVYTFIMWPSFVMFRVSWAFRAAMAAINDEKVENETN